MKEKGQETVSRRKFFGVAGKSVALGAGAVVTVATGAQAAVETPSGDGYRETEHVKTYYETTRF